MYPGRRFLFKVSGCKAPHYIPHHPMRRSMPEGMIDPW
jgi:hypothetical protein